MSAIAAKTAETATARRDVYAEITGKIVAQLENGVRPWARPWNASSVHGHINRPLRANGEPYRGINVLALWMAAEERNFAAPIWLSFKQALDLGGSVRKGEKGTLVVYANTFKVKEQADDGEEVEKSIPFLKPYFVFNIAQTSGLPERFYAQAEPNRNPDARNARCDAFFAATGARIDFGGNAAFYTMAEDRIQMPPFESFNDAASFFATLAHEATHWTRHPSRLNRDFGQRRFGDAPYAEEELVAELGAAFLCSDLGLAAEPRADHAAYLSCWLDRLRTDSRAIFRAAAHAQRAADWLHGLQPAAAA